MFNFAYKDIDFSHKIDSSTKPSESFSRHMHYFNEILFFVKGDVDYHVESESRKLSPGDIVIIPSGKFHFAVCNLNQPYERFVLKFPDDIIPSFLAERIKLVSNFKTESMKYFLNFSALEEYCNQFASDEEKYALCISELIKILVYLFNDSEKLTENKLNIKQNQIIKSVIDYIDVHLKENISLEDLCNHFYFSKSYLSNCFKKYMNTSIMQYIRSKKIIAAHRLILSGVKKTVAAEQYGFENYSTFYREYIKILSLNKKNSNN